MERTSDFEKLLFLYKTDGKGLVKNINMRRGLEAQEVTSGLPQEYLDMDKITLVKMLLAPKKRTGYSMKSWIKSARKPRSGKLRRKPVMRNL
jgi:hypothetical protein